MEMILRKMFVEPHRVPPCSVRALKGACHHQRRGLLPDLERVWEAPTYVTRHQKTQNQDTTEHPAMEM